MYGDMLLRNSSTTEITKSAVSRQASQQTLRTKITPNPTFDIHF